SNGTDFKCELMKESVWCGGGEKTLSGVFFNPNMPTEEIFTTPMKAKCSGRLVSSMPLSARGTLIENFYIDFEDGKAVSWHAEKGEEALGKIITTDEGSAMLGELALVPKDSAICQSGLLFYNTLFDENASCHVALGSGYTGCVKGFENMTLDELHALGVNDSMIHVDFMIGSSDLCITGYKNGVATPIFVDGKWAENVK
ncbi:MAG: aminopeptidase, partial [Clostridia bacterium]|nr:aminopeptidase [Clostridia bacterium]